MNRVNEKVRFGKWSRQIRGASAAKTTARTVVSWRTISESGTGGGGKRVIIVEGHAKIFGENKQTKKTKKLSITGLYRDRQCRPLILIKHL